MDQAFLLKKQSILTQERNHHYHNYFELVLVEKGIGRRTIGHDVSSISTDELILLGKHIPHVWTFDEKQTDEVVAYALYINPEFVELISVFSEFKDFCDLMERSGCGICFTPGELRLMDFRNLFYQQDKALRHAEIMRFLLGLSQLKSHLICSHDYKFDSGYGTTRKSRISQYIVQNFQSAISLGKIASDFNMSATSFSREFVKTFGTTFIRYLNHFRLEYAVHLLETTDLPILVIHEKSGFRNISNFNRQFKVKYGCTPTKFRQKTT